MARDGLALFHIKRWSQRRVIHFKGTALRRLVWLVGVSVECEKLSPFDITNQGGQQQDVIQSELRLLQPFCDEASCHESCGQGGKHHVSSDIGAMRYHIVSKARY